ncbi:MAG: 3-deoxy-7-phosphoheptulonate synthase [Bacteroidia bacterium]|jgi:3-deoxy-7-phosphoheptulonate synthase
MERRKPYQLVSREWKAENTVVKVNGCRIGDPSELVTIAGPCAVENREQIFTITEYLSKIGVRLIRGGAYKPRTSPYAFQGLKTEGLQLLRAAADKFNMAVVSEVMSVDRIEELCEYADVLQVGTRNMQNYPLLKALGKINKPVMLKRGMSSTVEEWLLAAEYILLGGNENVILCERGIRTFENATRNTLDLSVVPLVKTLSHLPVIVDPSQATGMRDLVPPMCYAAVAAGADGLIVEVHNQPEEALSDGAQSLYLDQFMAMTEKLRELGQIFGRYPDFDLFREHRPLRPETP